MAAILPSPSDHAEMPKRMIGRRIVRTCSCGKPWPCDQARWSRLREAVKSERDLLARMAAEHQSVFFNAKSDAYSWVLATMDRMEAGQ